MTVVLKEVHYENGAETYKTDSNVTIEEHIGIEKPDKNMHSLREPLSEYDMLVKAGR